MKNWTTIKEKSLPFSVAPRFMRSNKSSHVFFIFIILEIENNNSETTIKTFSRTKNPVACDENVINFFLDDKIHVDYFFKKCQSLLYDIFIV